MLKARVALKNLENLTFKSEYYCNGIQPKTQPIIWLLLLKVGLRNRDIDMASH